MRDELTDSVVDTLTLRFTGEDKSGVAIHQLRAAHVAEVLQGIVGLTGDFDRAGVFNPGRPGASEVLVRPAQEGSFLIEVVRVITENPSAAILAATGFPSLSTVIWWATKSVRAEVQDFEHLDNGNVKITWQDDTAQEVPEKAWRELNKRDRRRKKQLRQIMAPLSDPNVAALEVANTAKESDNDLVPDEAPETFVLTRPDFVAVAPADDVEETEETFETEAQMSAIDFDDYSKWRVKTVDRKRTATVEDEAFLNRVARGLAIRKSDIFRLRIRENTTKKNGRTRTSWTVLRVEDHRRAADDNDS